MKLFEAPGASKLVLKTLLVQGGVFRSSEELWDEGVKRRIFVVCNLTPATDDVIILFTATTQITKRRSVHKERADEVLVAIEPSTYTGATEASVFDCESPVKRRRSDFTRHVEAQKYEPLACLPPEILQRIIAAVRVSRKLSTVEKRLILGR